MSTKEIKTRSDGEENKVPHSISVRGNIATALKLLQNNSVLRRSPAGVPVHMDFAPEAVEMARSLFPAGKPYVFEMHFSSTLASTAGGVLQHIVSWDPSVSSFSEWTALSALFDECVYRHSDLAITSAFGPTSTAIVVQYAVAPDRENTGSALTYTPVQRLAESRTLHCYNGGLTATFQHTIPTGSRPWARTSAPGGAAGTPAGLLGAWCLSSNIVGTVSINYLFAALRVKVALRSRA
jgi:hypothetical protein